VNLKRFLRHVMHSPWSLRAFPPAVLNAIEAEIGASEALHMAELRFAIEASLPPLQAWRGLDSRERAIDLFSSLRVWDTAHNSGVLIYLLLADRSIEIVADRGIAARVEQHEWDGIALTMQQAYRAGEFEHGTLAGIRAITARLVAHFPATGDHPDELSNRPVVLR
jgi:uncharacterized membrane protein